MVDGILVSLWTSAKRFGQILAHIHHQFGANIKCDIGNIELAENKAILYLWRALITGKFYIDIKNPPTSENTTIGNLFR